MGKELLYFSIQLSTTKTKYVCKIKEGKELKRRKRESKGRMHASGDDTAPVTPPFSTKTSTRECTATSLHGRERRRTENRQKKALPIYMSTHTRTRTHFSHTTEPNIPLPVVQPSKSESNQTPRLCRDLCRDNVTSFL